MKKIFLFILYILSYGYNYATPQVGDRLIYKGDTITIYPFILEQYIENSPDKEQIYNNIKSSLLASTACWRGFRALFEIRNDSLFLQKVYGKADVDLFIIFGKKDNIFVDWYSGILTSPKNCLIYEHDGWGGFYEYETDFSIRNGMLSGIEEFHNEIKPSVYTNPDTLMSFIKKNINYKNIKSVAKNRVIVKVEDVDNDGKITKVSIVRGHKDNDYNNEAIRVIKSIPKWQVIVRRGKKGQRPWVIPIIFEEKQ